MGCVYLSFHGLFIRMLYALYCLCAQAAERAYLLHKFRVLFKQEMDRKVKNEGLVPRLLLCGEKKKGSRNCLLRLVEAEEEDAPAAVLNYVVKDLCSELFIELLALM